MHELELRRFLDACPVTARAIVEVARPLGIAVHDHIIVGKDGHATALKLI